MNQHLKSKKNPAGVKHPAVKPAAATPTRTKHIDVVIPIVYPDYLILAIEMKHVDVPRSIPGAEFLPRRFEIPDGMRKLPYLGHAGALFFSGKSGLTNYYEYGRYDPAMLGLTRRVSIPDVKLGHDGRPKKASLISVLNTISRKSGQNGRILGAYIELEQGSFQKMHDYAKSRELQNNNPRRDPYTLGGNSCMHFSMHVAEAGGAKMPWILDPRPASFIAEVQETYPDLEFSPSFKLRIEGIELS